MPRSSTARGQPSDLDTLVNPTWDTSPNSFPAFYQELLKWLTKQETKYAYLCAYYYVLDKSRLACVSDNHAARLKAGLIVKGSFAKPTYVDPTTLVNLPIAATPAAPATPTASSSAEGSSSEGSATIPSPALPASPATFDRERHYANAEMVTSVDMDLFNLINELVLDDDTREEYAEAYQRSGTRLLIYFANKRDTNSSSAYADSIVAKMAAAEEIGLASVSVAEFNLYKSKLSSIRKLLPVEVPCSDITFAHKLVTAVINLGPLVRSEVNNAMRVDKSRGDLAKTKETLISVLTELEDTDRTVSDKHGKAMMSVGLGDPATGRSTKGSGPPGRGRGRGRGGGGAAPPADATPRVDGHADRAWKESD